MFTLKETQDYLDDIRRLPKDIREVKLPITHRQLQEDPRQSGLRSHPFNSFRSGGVFRSDVDQKYRVTWWYSDDHAIVLWRVGVHGIIDELEHLKRIPQVEIGKVIEAPRIPEGKDIPVIPEHPLATQKGKPIFAGYNATALQLFGVPPNMVERVRKATDMDEILILDLPSSAKSVLLSIWTDPEWDPENLIQVERVLFRANADHLEHFCKGKIRRLMLDLSDEQEKIVRTRLSGTMLVKGTAGSGKTTVGIYRALILSSERRMFDTQPVLFLTYNETLARVISQMFEELIHSDEYAAMKDRVMVKTMRDWARDYLGDDQRIFDLSRSESVLASLIADCLPKEERYQFLKQEGFIFTEISQVIKGRFIQSWNEYRQIERIGRGQPLVEKYRRIIWDIYQEYQAGLCEKNLWDEADLYLEASAKLVNDAHFEPYAEVVVDEAQDLPPTALALAGRLAGGGGSERLALLADPTQSIYYRGISWKDGGVKIHSSRIRTLKKNFRNTRQILEAAWSLAEADPGRTLSEAISPEKSQRFGMKPVVMEVNEQSEQEIKCVKDLIVGLVGSNRWRLGDIAVLSRKKENVEQVRQQLRISGIPACHFREESFNVFENNVKVITINSAKGLEFPVVIMMNADEGDLPRNLNHIQDHDDREAALRIERQLFYVGMTRAAEELFMVCTQNKRSRFIEDIRKDLLKFETVRDEQL